MYRIRHMLLLILVLIALFFIGSCANHFIAKEMVKAPNQSLLGAELSRQFERVNNAADDLIRLNGFTRNQVSLGNEAISISYFDIPPGNYGYEFSTWPVPFSEIEQTEDSEIKQQSAAETKRVRYIHTQWQWLDRECFTPNRSKESFKQQGTLLMLHGWGRDGRSLISYAVQFAQLGLRVIVPDLRGHGQSSSEWLSFGEQEAEDMKLLADHLHLENFDIFGFSLGASTALHMAGSDERVQRIIAVASMHSIEQTIPKFGARSRPWIAWILDNEEQDIVSKAGEISGFNLPVSSDTLNVSRNVAIPTLLVYGEVDHMSDDILNRALFNELQGPKQLNSIQNMRHTHLLQHQTALSDAMISWLGLNRVDSVFLESACEVQEYVL